MFQGLTQQRLCKIALLASSVHAACGYAASDSPRLFTPPAATPPAIRLSLTPPAAMR